MRKSPHENERQFIWRLGNAKDAGLLDLSWDELGDIFNRELRGEEPPYQSSAYRKPYQYARDYYYDVFSKMEGEELSEDLKEHKRELEKEKKKLQTEKLEYNQWLREEARDELIMEKICDAVRELNEKSPLEVPLFQQANISEGNKSWVLAFGDAHFGAELSIKGLHGETINEYSPEIFYKRMENLLNQVIQLINKEYIEELYVMDLGDAIDGILRVSQLMKLRFGVVKSALLYANYLAKWLNDLSKYCPIIYQQTGGNHSEIRHLGQKKGSFPEDNMSEVVIEFLKMRLENNSRIKFRENDTGMIFDTIQGYNVLGFHGESKNLEATMKNFSKMYKTDIDILIAGHLHHTYNEAVGICSDVMRTPSIIGVDDFSMSLAKTSNPGATMFVIESGKGKVVDYHIKL